MAIEFYDPAVAKYTCYKGYSGVKWHDSSVIGDVPNSSSANTEAGIRDTITCMASKFTVMGQKVTSTSGKSTGDASNLHSLVTGGDYAVVVVKGIHQRDDPHITIGFATQLYHLRVENNRAGDREKWKVSSISVGEVCRDDAEWSVVKRN